MKEQRTPHKAVIIVAGATGELGSRIVYALRSRQASVRAIVRPGSSEKVKALRKSGAEVREIDFDSEPELTEACRGGTCVVSALSGLRDVMVDLQTRLLLAAVAAGVPRFIPSDFSVDFTKLSPGTNRNLNLRKEFGARLDAAPIAATSILNGMFTNLLTGQAPVILFGLHRIAYWGDADQPLDFTTINDTAAYTAAAALDAATPRYLYIAGDVLSARGLQQVAGHVTGKDFKLLRAGGLGRLDFLIKVTRALMPRSNDVFPPWQGMQYMRNMFSGVVKLPHLDNDRYSGIRWTSVREVLAQHLEAEHP